MRSKKIWVGFVLCLCLISTGCRKSPDAIASFLTARIASYLDLDEGQKLRLEAIREEFFRARAETLEERSRILSELRHQVLSTEMELGKLLELAYDHRRAAREKVFPRVLAKVIEFHRALRQEQKELIASKLGATR